MRSSDGYIGRVFGNYRTKSRIACGSFGCVYLAHHLWLNRTVAIKLLHTSLFHAPSELQRFLQEARILEQLSHPSIVRILDYGISGDLPYLVLAYASHGSLADLLERQPSIPLAIADTLTILAQVGDALHYAHQHGILHHDLKPANILFNSRKRALLTDFGIALSRITTTVKHPSASSGTPLYMAPEQFLGKVGPKSDQYALGCIAYELFTGRPPFLASNTMTLAYMHIHETPVSPRLLNPDLPLSIEYALLKALEKESDKRHDDVASFIAALHAPIPTSGQFIPSTFRQTVVHLLKEVERLSKLHHYQEALALCDQALQLNPQYRTTLQARARLLTKLNRYEEALTLYRQMASLAPEDSRVWKSQGDLLCQLKRYREAVAAYTKAAQLDPRNPRHYYAMSHALSLLGWPEEARSALEKARQLDL